MSEPGHPSRFDRTDDVVVMKFGGTSVEDAAAIRRLIGIVQSRRNAQKVVVVSALAKVTDQLLESGRAAASGHLGSALATVRNIYVRHEQLAESLADGSADSGGPAGSRAQAVTLYFQEHLLGSAMQPLDLQQGVPVGAVGPAPQGLTITISVVSG